MAKITITGQGSSVDSIVANIREQLDEQFGEGEWSIDGDPEITIALSLGGQAARVAVTLHVDGDRASTEALPRSAF